MPNYIEPRRFNGKRISISPYAEGDVPVIVDGLRAGWIRPEKGLAQELTYIWTMTAPDVVNARIKSSGEEATLQAAVAAFQQAFDTWLTWALALEQPVVWHE